jgi:aerobic carbon-monoxide dehydrogenase medium subunit
VICAPFEYVVVDSFEAASAALTDLGEDAKILAGGQSLVPMMSLRLARPAYLVDINGIPTGLPAIEGGSLHIPSLTRHAAMTSSSVVHEAAPLLAAAASHVGNVRIRNRGTLGGSLANAEPTAELSCAALALDAEVVAVRGAERRRIRVDDLFDTYFTTTLEDDEVIEEVVVAPQTGSGWSFLEVVRRSSDYAVVAVAVLVEVDSATGTVTAARVGLSGVGDRPVLADVAAVSSLVGRVPSEADLEEVSAQAASGVQPVSDVHGTSGYKTRLTRVLTRRALTQALARATGVETV